MIKKTGKYFYLLTAAIAVLLVSCKDDMYDNGPKEPLKISQTNIKLGGEAGTVAISVTSQDSWEVSEVPSWLVVTPPSGRKGISRVTIGFHSNEDGPATRYATLKVTSGEIEKTIEIEQLTHDIEYPNQDQDWNLNTDIHTNVLNKWYYNGETINTKASYNMSCLRFFEAYLAVTLTENKLDGKKWADKTAAQDTEGFYERYLYSYIERKPGGTRPDQIPLNYGMEFDLVNGSPYSISHPVARILYVVKGSPADRAGLKRGDWFYKVNDIQMQNYETKNKIQQYNERIDSLVNPIEGVSIKLGMLSFQTLGRTLQDRKRSVTITPDRFHGDPILYSNSKTGLIQRRNIKSEEMTRTGYMVYNSFDPSPIFKNNLVNEFAAFKQHNPTHFILDLRYNKTGTVEMAKFVADLLVPEEARDKVFANYKFSENSSKGTKTVLFEPNENSIQIDTLFILTSKHTTGAAELLINALYGIDDVMKTVVVGETTEGMNVGMVRVQHDHTDKEEKKWVYDMWIEAVVCTNGKGFGAYDGGIVPGEKVGEWDRDNILWSETWGWKPGSDGEGKGVTQDALLSTAMDFVVGIKTMPDAGMKHNDKPDDRSGYIRRYSVKANMTIDEY